MSMGHWLNRKTALVGWLNRHKVLAIGIVTIIIAITGAMQERELAAFRLPDVLGSLRRTHIPALRKLPKCPKVIQDEVGHILCGLPTGYAAFNAPETMTRDEPQVISLVVSVSESPELLAEVVKSATGDTISKIETREVSISQRMKARLEGQGFQITPTATEAVPIAVPKTGHVEWQWQVTPKESGDQLLVLTLDAMVSLKAGETPSTLAVMRRRIHVDVRMRDMANDWANWAVAHWPLFAAVGVGLTALLGIRKVQGKT